MAKNNWDTVNLESPTGCLIKFLIRVAHSQSAMLSSSETLGDSLPSLTYLFDSNCEVLVIIYFKFISNSFGIF